MIVKLLRGEPTVAHLVASADFVPGQVTNVGLTPVIAVNRVKSGEVGAFAVSGGIYEMIAQTSTGAPVAGSACTFAATNVKISTSTGNILGVCLKVASAVCEVLHQPTGVTVA